MIKLEKTRVYGFEAAIRGMRNPHDSWDKSDSDFSDWYSIILGPNDHELAMKLAKAGGVHAKYRRMIKVSLDVTAPRYWWTEYDTYKIGTTSNSCSTMHTIHKKEFSLEDFSCERVMDRVIQTSAFDKLGMAVNPKYILDNTIDTLNALREAYLATKNKDYWYSMIQMLPQSYNQKRTIDLNYEVLSNIYRWRRHHKLREWHEFCDWIETLPYSEFITLKDVNEGTEMESN